MSEGNNRPVFLVDAYSDPVVVRLEGRACHANCACLRDFLTQMLAQAKTRFVMDFQHCSSMDSTFLGILAGVALELRRQKPPGSLTLCRVSRRNLELLRNLGLHRLLTVEAGDFPMDFGRGTAALDCATAHNDLQTARLVLAAHENLIAADSANQNRFEDVLAFLRNRLEQNARVAADGTAS